MTLLETMVVVLVIGALVTVSAVYLRGSKHNADDAASLANIRTHLQAIASYAVDCGDKFPAYLAPSDPSFFTIHSTWPGMLAERYYNVSSNSPVFVHPGAGKARDGMSDAMPYTPYFISCSLYASPRYWRTSSRVEGPLQVGAQSTTGVVFSSQKAVVFEPYPALGQLQARGTSRTRPACGFADGSSRRFPWADLLRAEQGDGTYYAPMTTHVHPFPPPLHTAGGIEGRDTQ